MDNVSYPRENGDDGQYYRDFVSDVESVCPRWGIMASNGSKDVIIENSILNRVDAHQGIWNLIVKNSIIGQHGFTLIGGGTFIAENVIVDGSVNLVNLRSDYGSTWNGIMIFKDSKFILPPKNSNMIRYMNDGTWDFGYKCYYPNIIIENLNIDNSRTGSNMYLVPIRQNIEDIRNFHYNFSDYIIIKNVSLPNDKKLSVFPSANNLNQSLYGSGTKTHVNIFNTLLEEADVSVYNTVQSQFNVIDNSKYQ